MVKFIGEYKAKVDDKGRVVFPSAFKAMMGDDADLRFVVKKSLFTDCLEMYTYAEWEKDSEEVRSRLNMFNRKHKEFWSGYMRGSALVEPDGKLGRMGIPKDLMKAIGIDEEHKEVVFSGCNHLIEIWRRDNYEAQGMSDDEFTALAEEILG